MHFKSLRFEIVRKFQILTIATTVVRIREPRIFFLLDQAIFRRTVIVKDR